MNLQVFFHFGTNDIQKIPRSLCENINMTNYGITRN